MAKSWVGPSSNRRLNTERKDTGLRKFVGLGGLSLPRSRARYFSANRSTWLILLIPLAVLIIGGVLTGILDYSLYFGITAFVATPTIPFAAKSYVDGAIHKRMQAIPEIDWTHPSARSWNEHVYRWIFANALFFLVSGCLLLGYNLINTASSEVISPTSQPNTLVFVLGMAMFLFSCLQVVPIIHFGLWPERDIPMKIARYSRAMVFPNLIRGMAIGGVLGIEYIYSLFTYVYVQYFLAHGLGTLDIFQWTLFGSLVGSYVGAAILILGFQPFEPTVSRRWAYVGMWLIILPILGLLVLRSGS